MNGLRALGRKKLIAIGVGLVLLLGGCSSQATPDMDATVGAGVAATVAAQTVVAATMVAQTGVEEAIAATLAAMATETAGQALADTTTPIPSAGATSQPSHTPSAIDTPPPTNTPGPTSVPTQEGLGSRGNPYSVGEAAPMFMDRKLEFTLTVVEVLRGDPAWERILDASDYNDPAPEGFEWVMARIEVSYTGQDEGLLEISESDFAVVTKGRVLGYMDIWTYTPSGLEPKLDVSLFPGGSAEGWIAVPVALDDPSPLLAVGLSAGVGGVFFSLTP